MTTLRRLFPDSGPGSGDRRGGNAYPYTVLDVFTDTPLEGNPLAVFTDGRDLSTEEMQRLARELNLSETVFVLPAENDGDARIRIFTPTTELPFAGHPILGTAFVVAEALGADEARLETSAGLVPVAVRRDGSRIVYGRMDQPVPTWELYERSDDLLTALGVEQSMLPVEAYRNGPRHVYVMLESEAQVSRLRPDLSALSDHGAVGASCFAGAGTIWKSRMFGPGLGVAEDPATGSAAGPLAVHLARHGKVGYGEEIEIRQGAELGRPSLLRAQADGSSDSVERVQVGGGAVVVAHGEFLVRSARAS